MQRTEADRLAGLIRPGSLVVVGQGTAEPTILARALVGQRHAIGRLQLFLGAVFSETFPPEETDGIRFLGYGGIGGAGRLARAGRLDVVPTSYGRLPQLFEGGGFDPDVVLLQVAAGPEGPSLGLANDYVAAAARRAPLVIAEVNARVPWTHGAPADMRIDHWIESDEAPVALPAGRCGAVEEAIAANVAGQIPDGAVLQLGIGAIPDAIMTALAGHRDLGIHSGMIGDRVADLIEAGVITNARKPFDAGVTVAGTLFGTARLNAFADRNPALRVAPPSYTHAISVLARIPRLVTLNSAVEVDLTGQVNAEVAGGHYVGAVGGQSEFVRGALAAPEGRSIIALPSTARDGQVSRIVPTLAGPVTTLRSDADLVVTEWGVAELRGRSLAERARRLIAVAAPAWRDELSRAAHAFLRAAAE